MNIYLTDPEVGLSVISLWSRFTVENSKNRRGRTKVTLCCTSSGKFNVFIYHIEQHNRHVEMLDAGTRRIESCVFMETSHLFIPLNPLIYLYK